MTKVYLNQRNSSIELLRIVSILMVLVLHVVKDMIWVNEYDMININKYILYVAEALCIVSVNCFILISGYFSVTGFNLKIRRIFDLIFLVSFYGIIIYLTKVVIQSLQQGMITGFSVKESVKCIFPYFFNRCWFINIYVVLCLISPFINVMVMHLSKKQYKMLLVICLLLFSVWATFLPNPPSNDEGYGIVTFVMIYLIGGYLRLHFTKKLNPIVCAVGYLLCVCLTLLNLKWGHGWIWYNSIFNVAGSVMLFLTFLNFKFQSNTVNSIAKSVIAVLVIHTHYSIRPYIFVDWFKLPSHLHSIYFAAYFAGTVLVIYTGCTLIDYIRRGLFKISFDKVFNKIKIVNKIFEIS